MHDLADLAGPHILHGRVDDAGLDVEHGFSRRTGLAQLVLRFEHGGERRDLGLAVEVPQPHGRQALLHLAQNLDRHDRRAVVALAQRRQVRRVEQRRAQQRNPDRRRREERRDPVPGDERQDDVGPRLAGDDVGRPEIDRRAEEHVELGAMIERQGMQHDVVCRHLALDDAAHVLPDHRLVGEHRALRQRLGAAGVDDLRQHRARRPRPASRTCRPSGSVRRSPIRPDGRSAGVSPGSQNMVATLLPRAAAARPVSTKSGPTASSDCARALQDERDLVGIEHEVDRHQHRADPRERKAHRRERVRVARQDRDPVAGADVASPKPSGEPRTDVVRIRRRSS